MFVDGEYLPRHYHPLQILNERQAVPVTKSAMKRFFLLKMRFSFRKISPVVDVHAADNDLYGVCCIA